MAESQSTTGRLDSLQLEIIDPAHYATHGYPHDAWTRLRHEAPVFFFDRSKLPFWAITRHSDVVEISRHPERFLSAPRFQVLIDMGRSTSGDPDSMIQMDPPQHGRYRQLVSQHFTPRALRSLENELDRIAGEVLDDLARKPSGECDFAKEVSAPLIMAFLSVVFGMPEEDWRRLLRWTNEFAELVDPEHLHAIQEDEGKWQVVEETLKEIADKISDYFITLTRQRQADPRNDLASALANAELDGAALSQDKLLAYYTLLLSAGIDPARHAMSGGMLAFIEHPAEWSRLKANPELVPSATEEILRWTSPTIHMARTSAADTEIRGQKIRAGETVAMFYPSANRDEEVFDQPFAFRTDRKPNRHLALGTGEHFCLGAHLARLEIQIVFKHLARRLRHVELAGPVEYQRSCAVGGVKRLPIRYRLARTPTA